MKLGFIIPIFGYELVLRPKYKPWVKTEENILNTFRKSIKESKKQRYETQEMGPIVMHVKLKEEDGTLSIKE